MYIDTAESAVCVHRYSQSSCLCSQIQPKQLSVCVHRYSWIRCMCTYIPSLWSLPPWLPIHPSRSSQSTKLSSCSSFPLASYFIYTTTTWVNFGRWWGTGRPGVLQSMGLQRVRRGWVTGSSERLNNKVYICQCYSIKSSYLFPKYSVDFKLFGLMRP